MLLNSWSHKGFPHSSVGKQSACNAGDPGSIPGLGRSAGEGKGYPLQYSGLENSMKWILHGITKSQNTPITLYYFSISFVYFGQRQANEIIRENRTFNLRASQAVLMVKNLPANAGDVRGMGSIPRLGRSPGGGHGNSLLYSCWRIPWTEEPGGLQSIGSQRAGHD